MIFNAIIQTNSLNQYFNLDNNF